MTQQQMATSGNGGTKERVFARAATTATIFDDGL